MQFLGSAILSILCIEKSGQAPRLCAPFCVGIISVLVVLCVHVSRAVKFITFSDPWGFGAGQIGPNVLSMFLCGVFFFTLTLVLEYRLFQRLLAMWVCVQVWLCTVVFVPMFYEVKIVDSAQQRVREVYQRTWCLLLHCIFSLKIICALPVISLWAVLDPRLAYSRCLCSYFLDSVSRLPWLPPSVMSFSGGQIISLCFTAQFFVCSSMAVFYGARIVRLVAGDRLITSQSPVRDNDVQREVDRVQSGYSVKNGVVLKGLTKVMTLFS